MKSIQIRISILAAMLFAILACSGSGDAEATGRLAGTWVETGGSDSMATFTDTRMTREYPKAGGKPIESNYKVKSVDGDKITISVQLDMGDGKTMDVDDQIITFDGDDKMKLENAKNGSGGTFKRKGSGDDGDDKEKGGDKGKEKEKGGGEKGGKGKRGKKR